MGSWTSSSSFSSSIIVCSLPGTGVGSMDPLKSSGGRIGRSGSVLGIRPRNGRGNSIIMFRMRTASHKYLKFLRRMPVAWSNNPPIHEADNMPTLSTDISNAKNVPSMPAGHNLAAKTRRGIHLIRLIACRIHITRKSTINSKTEGLV